jgi:endonuclease/exonuclease/phosphatase family metal-dependent hydrolase
MGEMASDGPPALRIVSANLRRGGSDAEAFARLVASLAPDVVAVQELVARHADALARVLPWGLLAPARDYSGMGIALARPGAVTRLPLPCRDAYIAEVASAALDGGAVQVINVHLQAPHIPPVWRTVSARRGQVRGILDYLDASPARRRALVGDLNATPLWPAYRRLAGRLEDGALAVARQRGVPPRRTWGPGPAAPRLFRIDHVLLDGLVARDVRVVPVPGSDHHAVVADLDLHLHPGGERPPLHPQTPPPGRNLWFRRHGRPG